MNVLAGTEEDDNPYSDGIVEVEESFEGRAALRSFLEKLTLDTTTLGSDDSRDHEGVTLITMHNTKGLEYDTVFCAGLEENIIPGRNGEEPEMKEEERRILYVAMTRARRELFLSYATQRLMWGRTEYTVHSSFFREIPEEMLSGDVDSLRTGSSMGSSFSSYRRSSGSFSGYSGFPAGSRSGYGSSSYQKKPETTVSNTPSWAQGIGMPKTSGGWSKPKSVEASKGYQTGFKEGDRVKSETMGGSIVAVEEKPGKRILTIQYDSGRKMRIVEGNSPIERI